MKTPELPDETLFENALNQPNRAERDAYLDQACAGRAEVRRRIEELIQAHEAAGEFMNGPASDLPTLGADPGPEEAPGSMVGRYKLLQKIGEGGMGVVYMAEQAVPVVRKVALKIIKLGMDTRQVVARFEAERQALALMDHPNIAKVLDAGSTEAGRPFFVMELVRGVPITEYCDKNRLSARDRLELFLPVCHAIQHAHQKGIIHRDIKPSNVMVTLHDGRPVPRVIDFGIAKATNQRLTDKTLFTNYAQLIGTPAYMSPEQAEMSGLDIDTRADVYSLGVLLYELLAGVTPFDAGELLAKGCAELQRFIAEQEPPRPSTRMSTLQDAKRTVVAANRSTDQAALRRSLEGYRKLCALEVEKFRNTTLPHVAERMAKDALILPDSGVDPTVIAAWTDLAVTAGQGSGDLPWFQSAKGLAEYRRGRFAEAVEWVSQALARLDLNRSAQASAVLAKAQHRLGNKDAAAAALAKALESRAKLPKVEGGDIGPGWLDWIITQNLIREASELIQASSHPARLSP